MIQVVKIGGGIIDEPEQLQQVLQSFAEMKGPRILVHGGGRSASEMSKALGIEPKMVDGRRITDAATLKVACMMYAGLINKQMVASLQALGVNAIGVSGADANLIPAHKRPVKDIDYGWVGDVVAKELNPSPLKMLLNAGFAPVFCALTHDTQGHMLNTNADTVAMSVATMASKIEQTSLVFAFEKKGVLKDVNDDDSLIPELSIQAAQELIQSGKIHSGMRPKIKAAADALANGVQQVHIVHANQLQDLQHQPKNTPHTRILP